MISQPQEESLPHLSGPARYDLDYAFTVAFAGIFSAEEIGDWAALGDLAASNDGVLRGIFSE